MSHAILSPSGAHRWLTCTPSARLESKVPDSAGEAAAEGTLAHAIGELMIKHERKLIKPVDYWFALNRFKQDSLFKDEMLEYLEEYKDFVMERYNDALALTPDALMFHEVLVNLKAYVPDGFGTIDNDIIADGTMEIIDLKYGKGLLVDAKENEQMMLYALGALDEYEWIYDIQRIKMTIYQPRLHNFSTYLLTVQQLKDWAANTLVPKAKLAFEGIGEFVAGDHCTFCRVRATCKANRDYNMEIMKEEFAADPVMISDEDVSFILSRADSFTRWLTDVKDFALSEAALNNKKWPGYKLVEGRSNRVYGDELTVVTTITKETEHTEDDLYNKKLKGITEMTKLLGKKVFEKVVEPLMVKPKGAPVLVPEDDKRPELNSLASAQSDFAVPHETPTLEAG